MVAPVDVVARLNRVTELLMQIIDKHPTLVQSMDVVVETSGEVRASVYFTNETLTHHVINGEVGEILHTAKMTEEEITEVRDLLRRTQHWNDGFGLVIHPSLATRLEAAGISGPYAIQEPNGAIVRSPGPDG